MQIDRLEPRMLLAGDVSVRRTDAGYRFIGDDADNDIVITRVSGETTFLISGRNGTTVDGGTTQIVYSADLDHFINLGAGDDRLSIDRITFARSVKIDLGTGDDTLFFTRAETAAVDIHGGEGDDRINVSKNTMARLRIFPGDGFDRTGVSETRLRRGVEVGDLGRRSMIGFRDVSASAQSWVSSGGGYDRLEILTTRFDTFSARLRGGFDEIDLRGAAFGSRWFDMGEGTSALNYRYDFVDGADGWTTRVGPLAEASKVPPSPYVANVVGESKVVDLPDDGVGPVYQFQYAEGESAFLHRDIDPSLGVRAGRAYTVHFDISFNSPTRIGEDGNWYIGDLVGFGQTTPTIYAFDGTEAQGLPPEWGGVVGVTGGEQIRLDDGVFHVRIGSSDQREGVAEGGIITTYLRSVQVSLIGGG